MNATLFDGGKVHRVIDAMARCGVDKVRKRRQWQIDFGDVTCGRCGKLVELDGRKEAQKAQKTSTTDQHR